VQLCPTLYITSAVTVMIDTTATVRFEPGISCIAVRHVTTRPMLPALDVEKASLLYCKTECYAFEKGISS